MSRSIFKKSHPGNRSYSLPKTDPAFDTLQPPMEYLRKKKPELPEIAEIDLTRHLNDCARRNVGIDTIFYPLGSCTMKLNPRVNEWAAALTSFAKAHPLLPDEQIQGSLQIMEQLIHELCQISGMVAGSLAPNAGAQGEFVGVQMIRRYHCDSGEAYRNEMIIPDNAHGTNPATAAMIGFKTISVRTNKEGDIDLEHLSQVVSEKTAGLMLTNPNTLGLFSSKIQEIAAIIHQAGGLLYYDGANLNPILEIAKPGQMGFDVMHINLHKTFSTPHGGGGPGAGPVLCNKKLEPYLPIPQIKKIGEAYKTHWEEKKSIGKVSSFRGNFAVCLRAYLYIKLHGAWGLRRVAEQAVLNANYLKHCIEKIFTIPFSQPCMHEFVVQADRFLDRRVRAFDIAKRLLDYGFHAPTIYFPLIIKECMLIEPTECESKQTLDAFVEALSAISQEAEKNPELLKAAPLTLSVGRLDEVAAVKDPVLIESTTSCSSCC